MLINEDSLLRFKPIYPVYRVTGSTFRIGAQLGITAEIYDPEGQGWLLAHLMDGTRSFHEIVTAMQAQFPSLGREDIEEGVEAFDQQGFLEDAKPSSYDGINDEPLTRFIGNVNYFSHFAKSADHRGTQQDILRESKIALLGLGGGGSNVLPLLVASGIGHIIAVDYDRVERTNLNRQLLYREGDIGSLKTEIAQRIVNEMNSLVDFTIVTRKITSVEDVRSVIKGADLVICAMDEPPVLAQRRVNRACILENIPCLYGLSQITSGRIFSVLPYQSGCVDCLLLHGTKIDPLYIPQLKGFLNAGFTAPTMSFAPHIAKLSGLIAHEAIRLLTNYTVPQSVAKQLEYDYEADSLQSILEWPQYVSECPTCGTGHEKDFPLVSLYPEMNLGEKELTIYG
jgi:molybdopterin/thiamine biosynthesis adenylyltransferase